MVRCPLGPSLREMLTKQLYWLPLGKLRAVHLLLTYVYKSATIFLQLARVESRFRFSFPSFPSPMGYLMQNSELQHCKTSLLAAVYTFCFLSSNQSAIIVPVPKMDPIFVGCVSSGLGDDCPILGVVLSSARLPISLGSLRRCLES